MKAIWYLTIGILLVGGIDILITSTIYNELKQESIEVPRLVSVMLGSFIIYGAYIIWDELVR